MAFFKAKFDSIKQDWNTPLSLFNKLNSEFQFNIDLAASSENKLCENFYSAENDGLSKVWQGVCWCNPPYGDKKSKMVDWIKKAHNDTKDNPDVTVVMLIPARTNTKWFANNCMSAAEIRFITGRPKFSGMKHGLPQPLIIVVFKKNNGCKFSNFVI